MLTHWHLEQIDSTQDELERHLEAGDENGEIILVSTSRQTKGRGRGAHTWNYLNGALAFSFCMPPHPQLTWQSLEVAVCLANFFKQKFHVELELKWPNDLYTGDKKCGGILLKSKGKAMLIGIGINLMPDEVWGSVFAEKRSLPDEWQRNLPAQFLEFYLAHHPMEPQQIRDQWNARCVHLNRQVAIIDGDHVARGLFKGLGKHGEAVLGTSQGEDVTVFNGSLRWES